MIYVQPTTSSIADLLEFIFGEGIAVSEGAADGIDSQHVATFLDPDDKLVAACACDLPFVSYSGAALSMIPADVANEMISGDSLTDAIKANFYEVMNICSKLMMKDGGAHLRLEKVVAPAEASEAIAGLSGVATTGFNVDIPKYGKGELNFLIS